MSGAEFSKHAPGLSIGYNGSFLDKSSKEKCGKTGVILTRGGRVFVRDSKHDPWDDVATPSVFLFHDNENDETYLVDKNRKSISQIDFHGRVLDCTDRVIYEVKDCQWSPVCDLSEKLVKTIVRCSHLSACQSTGPISSRQVSLKLLKKILKEGKCDPCEPIEVASLPGCELTIPFDVLGCNAEVLCEFSEIDADLVDLCNGFLSVDAVPPGECAVLIYETCLCDEKVIVAHLFIRDPIAPRFSAKCGQFVPAGTPVPASVVPPFSDPLCPDVDPCLTQIVSAGGVTTNLYQLQNWVSIYQEPAGQFSSSGVWTVPETGDYDVAAEIHLCSTLALLFVEMAGSIAGNLPYFILVRYPAEADPATTPGVIEVCAPIELNTALLLVPPSSLAFIDDRLESAHASIDVGLRLNVGETLVIYYVDSTDSFRTLPLTPTTRGYRTVRCATTFNAHFLGCAPPTPFPTPPLVPEAPPQ